MANNKRLRLIGRMITPMIVKKPLFYIKGCKVTITKYPKENEKGYLPYPRKKQYGKLIKGERRAPTIRNCFQGFIVVDFPGENNQAKKRLQWFFQQEALGAQQKEGMGKIKWLEKKEIIPSKKQPQERKLKIRKGLGYYPKPMLTAIKALLLHDFIHTPRHESKIYQEVNIHNKFIREACKKHHHNGNEEENWLVKIIKKYDRQAALRMRRIPTTATINRYDYQNGEINCQELAEEITEKQESIHALYNFIYYSKTIARFYESMIYVNNKLRNHLLLAVNLLINDFKKGKITLENNKLKIVSLPTREKEEENEKFLSKSLVLKRINSSKKGVEKQTATLQERTVEEENPSAKDREKPLAMR
ncbi:MAG: hypothetical protein HZR80_14745 [Candidatus Heimdallarchaeota archaeon]